MQYKPVIKIVILSLYYTFYISSLSSEYRLILRQVTRKRLQIGAFINAVILKK
jgi:hypothetical protein